MVGRKTESKEQQRSGKGHTKEHSGSSIGNLGSNFRFKPIREANQHMPRGADAPDREANMMNFGCLNAFSHLLKTLCYDSIIEADSMQAALLSR